MVGVVPFSFVEKGFSNNHWLRFTLWSLFPLYKASI